MMMLNRILNRKLINHRNIVYLFSKDPFERFNKKKDNKEDPKPKTNSDKWKDTKKDKPAAIKIEDKVKKPLQSTQPQETKQKQQKEESVSQKGFQKFNAKKSAAKEESFPQKDAQKQNNNDSEQQKEEQVTKKQASQAYFTSSPSKGFQKFKTRKRQATAQANKQNAKEEKQKQTQIPTQNLNLDDNDEKQTVVLRKTRGLKNKKKQQKLSDMINELNQNAAQSQQAAQPQIEKTNEEAKWQQFQQQKDKLKQIHKKNLPRYERLNLLKEDNSKQSKSKQKGPSEPINHKKNLTRLVMAGIGLFLLSNNDYFTWSIGKQQNPQYLKEALEGGRIVETWVQNTEFDLHNQQSTKGKNYESFIFIREKNGNIVYCVSNEQFQNAWFAMVSQRNLQGQKKNNQLFPMGGNLGNATDSIKMITNSGVRQEKKSNLVADSRSILSMVLLYFFIRSLMDLSKAGKGKGKGANGLFQNEKSHRFRQAIKVTFKDVVGMQKSKDEIVQFIDFLKFPQKYNKLGARIPKGALLTGPPGTGKTMIAKACAGQSKVPFFTISGSEFIEMYVGVGAQRVRNLFKEAKENAPSIIFIDQIDAVGKKRSGLGGGGNDERDSTLNQLLVQMDGFDTNTNVIVFAATNQKSVLDPALTRPGRFDRMIEIDLPDLQGRRQIFEVHLKPIILDNKIDIKQYAKRLATLTPGFSGADIKNICNEAAIIAARNNKQVVSIMDFQLATERIIGGVEKKSQLITPETRRTVAYHQCGHGVVSWFIQNANPLLKLTIIPRSKGALGFAQYLPNEHQMYTKIKLLDQICVILGGRIAQEIFFGKISTGASDDLNKAYQIAKAYVTQYGFGQKLGWIQYDQTQYTKEYSKDIENKIDSQILQIMRMCSQRTRTIITEKKDLIHKLAQKLLQIETIDQTIIEGILGPRPFKISKQHSEYIKEKKRMTEQILGINIEQGVAKQKEVKMKRSDYIL